jgi:hypothetical protein
MLRHGLLARVLVGGPAQDVELGHVPRRAAWRDLEEGLEPDIVEARRTGADVNESVNRSCSRSGA